jgi:hypothetical protein
VLTFREGLQVGAADGSLALSNALFSDEQAACIKALIEQRVTK